MVIIMVGLPWGTGSQSGFYRTRGQMVHGTYVPWRGREGGIYHCEIPDAMHVTQTIFIGVYLATTG